MDQEQGQTGKTSSEEPIYNIGVVSRMTGIPVATLRVWERRYQFPRAGRTAGGHRLYSEQELARLRWVKNSIDEGMQTSQAIRALRNQERQGRSPEIASPAPEALLPQLPAGENPEREGFQHRFTQALLTSDLERADQILGEIMAIASLEAVIIEVISPSLVALGDAWRAGHVDVATEHLASAFLRQRLSMWLATGPQAQPVRPVVLACAPNEWHELGLLMLAVLLRRRRWPVSYLGQATPLPDLTRYVRDLRPNVVVISATTEETARGLLALSDWLPEMRQHGRFTLAFAGRAFTLNPRLREQMPGTFLGATLTEGVETIERLLRETTALTV